MHGCNLCLLIRQSRLFQFTLELLLRIISSRYNDESRLYRRDQSDATALFETSKMQTTRINVSIAHRCATRLEVAVRMSGSSKPELHFHEPSRNLEGKQLKIIILHNYVDLEWIPNCIQTLQFLHGQVNTIACPNSPVPWPKLNIYNLVCARPFTTWRHHSISRLW